MQFPDLQVLLPRSFEVGRAVGISLQQQANEQEALARQRLQQETRAQQQVRQVDKALLSVDPDGRGAGGQGGRGARSVPRGTQEPPTRPADHREAGRRLDIRV